MKKLILAALISSPLFATAEWNDVTLTCQYNQIGRSGNIIETERFQVNCDGDSYAKEVSTAGTGVTLGVFIPEDCVAILGFFRGEDVSSPIKYKAIQPQRVNGSYLYSGYPKKVVELNWADKAAGKKHVLLCSGDAAQIDDQN